MRSDVEETETQKTKDSGYSNSSNSQSQRSSGSSKSRNSTSSGSSGFRPQTQGEAGEKGKRTKKRKEKEVPPLCEQSEEPECGGAELASAALSQTLASISRIQTSLPSPETEKWLEPGGGGGGGEATAPGETDQLAHLISKETSQEEELGIVVSLEDGLVMYTTPSISTMLGYPKDMWIGRSLIDFVHPRHRASFAGHITSVVASNDYVGSRSNIYSCYMRQYRGLKSAGFSLSDKWTGYLPLQLSMRFKEPPEQDPPRMFLVINAVLIKSAYTNSNETRTKFTTRHTSSSQLCHVDPEVTPYFGYLPQDILGRSILEFYHPADLNFLKEVYEAVMKEQGHLFRSKPYRFRCQNGGFALVETELSSFINPWSRKLEFIICQHTVLRGPPNPDVTTPVNEPEALQISEEVLKETKIVQEEIKCLLNETVVRNFETAKQQVTRRCKDLAAFMENLMDEISKPPNLKVDLPTEEQSISERDSVMLGEISPHHEYYDSKSSSETPPSYNQLNYNENIQRFFESKPKTSMSEDSSESKIPSGGEEGKISHVIESIGDSKSGGSGGSSGAQSTESNANSGATTDTTNTTNDNSATSSKPATLTEQLLTRHNEDMEKRMVQKHREQRTKSDTKVKDRLKTADNKMQEECNTQGVKRSGSHSWEGEPYKSIKAEHSGVRGEQQGRRQAETELHSPSTFPTLYPPKPEFPAAGFANPLMPLYYVANRRPDLQPLFPQQAPYVPQMVYQPVMFSPQPMVYSPLTMVSGPDLPPPPPPITTSQLISLSQPGLQVTTSQIPTTSSFSHSNFRNPLQDQNTESNETSLPFDDSSSSFYSLLKTDKSDESLLSSSENDAKNDESGWSPGKKSDWKMRPIKKVAPWIEDIKVTPEFVLKYQLSERPLAEILSQDLKVLSSITQPELVSEQLSQMYLELEGRGVAGQLEGSYSCASSSDSSSDQSMFQSGCRRQQRKHMDYDKMVMLFEEDAPLPPPILQTCT